MEKLNQQTEILKLGKRIINELVDEDNDSLTLLEKWMGNYIAELIEKVEHTKNEKEKKLLQKECFETIMKLWDKRYTLPTEVMPLGRIKHAIDMLNDLRRQKDIWKQIYYANPVSWENLAVKIHDSQYDVIKICIQAAIAEDAIEREKVWIDECSETLSIEEKEIIEKLDYLLKEPLSAITFTFNDKKVERKEVGKSKIERAFDRLENITDIQKKAIKKLRKELIKK